jgi:hypothetical protein
MGFLTDIGEFDIWKNIIIGIIISFITLCIAIYLEFYYDKGWIHTEATLSNVKCSKSSSKSIKCVMDITYMDNNHKEITIKNHTSNNGTTYKDGKLKIRYNPKDTNQIELKSKRTLALILGLISVLTGAGTIFTYINRHNKTFQKVEGAMGMMNML